MNGRLMRSKLFVPASRPELFAKAAASAADALSFDLEDAVPFERKTEARDTLAGHLASTLHDKVVVVRINALGTKFCEDDIAAVTPASVDIINVPKVEDPSELSEIAGMLDRYDPTTRVGILVNIETPKALRMAGTLAQSHPRVMGLQIGYADLLEPCGIDRLDQAALGYIRIHVRLAAAEAGLPAYDGAFFAVGDQAGCKMESLAARRSGFAGKSCIHPSQIAIINEAFSPTAAEVEKARRIVAAAESATRDGLGAFLVDGQMIDAPFLPRAQAIVEWANRQSNEVSQA
jgi:citrate lyase subunit beta / citryl-CoA lyase